LAHHLRCCAGSVSRGASLGDPGCPGLRVRRRPVCQAWHCPAKCHLTTTFRLPARAGCQHAGTKGMHDGNRRNRTRVAHRVHAAEYPVLRADGTLLHPGHPRTLRPRGIRRGRGNGHLRTGHQRDRARGRVKARDGTHPPGRLRALAVIVTDSSPDPPVRRNLSMDSEHGRGLSIIDALSARWGWRPEGPGKAVYAILAREA
jgi:hypothetical protein